MLAFLLILLTTAFWSIIGYSLLWALHSRRNLLQSALLAPAVGMAAVATTVAFLNGVGLPVRVGGPIATILLSGVAVWLSLRFRPKVPVRVLLPYIAVLLVAIVATGYPMFRYGFDWVSYCNDDMANYSLGAKLFLNHGVFQIPRAEDYAIDRDASSFYWNLYVYTPIRHGADELLAWLVSIWHLATDAAFMPLIISFHVTLLAAIGGLVMQHRKRRRASLWAVFVLAFSALTTLGATYQLLAQVAGLGLLAAAACLVLRNPEAIRRRSELLLISIVVSGFGIVYPEVFPFLVLSLAVYWFRLQLLGMLRLRTLLAVGASIVAVSVLLINTSLVSFLFTILSQASNGTRGVVKAGGTLFPYYLTPAGFAYLFGLYPIHYRPVGPLLDAGIVIGFLFFFLVVAGVVRAAWRGDPSASIALIMLGLFVQLFISRADFGLFKLAMYIQPFAVGAVVPLAESKFSRLIPHPVRRTMLIVAGLLFVSVNASTQSAYTSASLGDLSGALNEIPFSSSHHLISGLRNGTGKESTMLSDSSNVVLAKFESLHQGAIHFISEDFFKALNTGIETKTPAAMVFREQAHDRWSGRNAQFKELVFDLHSGANDGNTFRVRHFPLKATDILLSGPLTTILNRSRPYSDALVTARAIEALRNYLVFVESGQGVSYYGAGAGITRAAGRVSMYQPEPDYFFPSQTMVALGRHSLYRVLKPSDQLRMMVEFSASLKGDRENVIPPASAIGSERVRFEAVGRGSARMFSAPIQAQEIEDGSYVSLDMGTWGSEFPMERSLIMGMFGRDIKFDSRRVTGFSRDVSALSESEYLSLQAPLAISRFPDDLKNKSLEYSGIYEDGWVAEAFYAVLSQPGSTTDLEVRLMDPEIDGVAAASSVSLLVDGVKAKTTSIHPGRVSLRVSGVAGGKHKIEVQFDHSRHLPGADGRPVSAKLEFIGFE